MEPVGIALKTKLVFEMLNSVVLFLGDHSCVSVNAGEVQNRLLSVFFGITKNKSSSVSPLY